MTHLAPPFLTYGNYTIEHGTQIWLFQNISISFAGHLSPNPTTGSSNQLMTYKIGSGNNNACDYIDLNELLNFDGNNDGQTTLTQVGFSTSFVILLRSFVQSERPTNRLLIQTNIFQKYKEGMIQAATCCRRHCTKMILTFGYWR